MSGFGTTLFSFSELFPPKVRYDAGINQYMMKENADIANNPIYFNPQLLDIYYRNNWNNSKIVPESSKKQLSKYEPSFANIDGKKIDVNKAVHKRTGRWLFIKTENIFVGFLSFHKAEIKIINKHQWLRYIQAEK